MTVPSPRRSPSRPTATVGGASRLRVSSAARSLFACYRDVSSGVERQRDVSVERAAITSRRRCLSVGVEEGRAPTHLLGDYPGIHSRSSYQRPAWEDTRGGRGGFAASIFLLSRSDGCSGGAAPDHRTQELSSTIKPSVDDADPVEEKPGWANAPLDILVRIFETLHAPKLYWVVARVCSCWRFAAFLLKRPMLLGVSGLAASLDHLPFPPTHLKLFIAKPSRASRATGARMSDGRWFGYHRVSSFVTVQRDSRFIGSCSGIPLFLAADGEIELPSICISSFSEFIAERYRLPPGIHAEDVYLGIIDNDQVAFVTNTALHLSSGTTPGTWSTVSLLSFQIEKVTNVVLLNGVAYLLADDSRLFRAKFSSFSVNMSQVDLTMDLPVRQIWQKLWLMKCPTGGNVLCICYREVGDEYEFVAFDLIEREGAWAWQMKDELGDAAVFVNWGHGSLGFAHKSPARWGLRSNMIYHSHRALASVLNQAYDSRIMPREHITWPCPVWMLACPSELDLAVNLDTDSD